MVSVVWTYICNVMHTYTMQGMMLALINVGGTLGNLFGGSKCHMPALTNDLLLYNDLLSMSLVCRSKFDKLIDTMIHVQCCEPLVTPCARSAHKG